jgi:hypothetical protein
MKTCIQCVQEKPSEEFYSHPKMADGRLNKCKTCCKSYAKARRIEHPEIVRDIDRRKTLQPARKQWRVEYQRKTRKQFPEKYLARTIVSNAIKCGKIARQPCVKCGAIDAQAHHPDYTQPLNVVWLCFAHHREIHKETTQTA